MANQPNEDRISRARARLAANLGELQQRVTRARKLVSPQTYLASPWFRVGLGVAVGYLVGRRRPRRLLASGDATAPIAHGLIRAALRATVMSAAGALIERAIAHLTTSAPDALDDSERVNETGDPPLAT